MLVETDDLVTSLEIAHLLGVVPSAISNYQTRGLGFPEPAFDRGRIKLWVRRDVIEWWRARVGEDGIEQAAANARALLEALGER